MRQTQHDEIFELCKDNGWHCAQEFRDLHAYSPHKRRTERAAKFGLAYEDFWEERPCQHDGHGQKDYRRIFIRPMKKYASSIETAR